MFILSSSKIWKEETTVELEPPNSWVKMTASFLCGSVFSAAEKLQLQTTKKKKTILIQISDEIPILILCSTTQSEIQIRLQE